MQVPGTSGTLELLIPVEEGEVMQGPEMLPGGEWVLLTARAAGQASCDEAQMIAQSVTSSERTVLIDGGRDGRYLPTGHSCLQLEQRAIRSAVQCRVPPGDRWNDPASRGSRRAILERVQRAL